MSFDVPADAYLRFMGRYSAPLAELFVELAGVRRGDRVLDVGCGPGVLTAPLVALCGASSVAAVDPSATFVAAAHERFPDLDVREASAEALPYDDGSFDSALAQLVVQFMSDPVAGLREMGRVTTPGGTVGASVWDFGGGTSPLSVFWRAAQDVDAAAPGEGERPGTREGQLVDLASAAGLLDAGPSSLTVRLPFASFEEWWGPYLDGVGPAGSYLVGLDAGQQRDIEQRCRELLPEPPFEHEARALVVLARAPG
jgi:SAM-dependent methyltransferase